MGTTDDAVLDTRLAELERQQAWSPGLIAALGAHLRGADDAALVRMNPIAFARDAGVTAQEALDLFLHAAYLGVMTMDWHLLCPACGIAVENFASLRALRRCFFCALCNLHTESNLDDYIQVSFTVARQVRPLVFHDVEALTAAQYLFQLRFTREAHFGDVDGPRFVDVIPDAAKVTTWLEPGQIRRFTCEVEHGELAAAEFQSHTGSTIVVDPAVAASEIVYTIDDTSTTASRSAIAPGTITVTVENRRRARLVWLLANKLQVDVGPAIAIALEPIVTGAALVTSQTFRRLFRRETVQGADGIGVRDVTLVFTDLKGSTALYERMGDLAAFALVHDHFDRLGAVVQRHDGAIVKTIGDAVMAAFQRPADAVRAAIEMQRQIDRYNHERGSREIVLKIGVHRGPSIAVTLNDSLDFFGHTVNVAARVQGLADADEIFVTDDVFRADGVGGMLAGASAETVRLRGLQSEIRVHRIGGARSGQPSDRSSSVTASLP
jgi:class 3 adenylate cyclase